MSEIQLSASLQRLLRKKKPTATDLGIIELSNFSIFTATDGNQIVVSPDKLQKKIDKFFSSFADKPDIGIQAYGDYAYYIGIEDWIRNNRKFASTYNAEAQYCLEKITSQMKEAIAVECIKAERLLISDAMRRTDSTEIAKTMEKHLDGFENFFETLFTDIAFLNPDGIYGDGAEPKDSIEDEINKIKHRYSYIVTYNTVVDILTDKFSVPELVCTKISTETIENSAKYYNHILQFVAAAPISDVAKNLFKLIFPELSLEYSVPEDRLTQFENEIYDLRKGIFAQHIENVIDELIK